MIYTPNPKALVYSELFFISTVAPRLESVVTMDAIMDEVSREIFDLFIADDVPVVHCNFARSDRAAESEIRN